MMNKYYEAEFEGTKPNPSTNSDTVSRFIKDKYVKGKLGKKSKKHKRSKRHRKESSDCESEEEPKKITKKSKKSKKVVHKEETLIDMNDGPEEEGFDDF